MSRAKKPGADAPATTPALVSNATPADRQPAPGGVVPAETPTAPAVPSTEPLPSDQATAPERPIAPASPEDAVLAAAIDGAGKPERPSIVPETPPADALTAPRDEVVRGDTVMARVPGTVPLPADQVTPVAPVAAPASLREAIGLMSADDRAALRELLAPDAGTLAAEAAADEAFEGKRLFHVEYDVDFGDRVYTPDGEPVALTFAQYQYLIRATAVRGDWLRAELA